MLAHRWAPILLFSSREEYFPLGLESLVDAPAVKASRDTIKVKTVFGDERIPLPELSEFLRYNGHADYLLDQSAFDSQKVFDRVHGDFQHSSVYDPLIEEGGTGFLNLPHLLRVRPEDRDCEAPRRRSARVRPREPHVRLPAGSLDAPSALVLSAHLEGQTILYFDSLKLWSHGRVKMPLPDPRVADVHGHVIVPVAEGLHALYPAPGHTTSACSPSSRATCSARSRHSWAWTASMRTALPTHQGAPPPEGPIVPLPLGTSSGHCASISYAASSLPPQPLYRPGHERALLLRLLGRRARPPERALPAVLESGRLARQCVGREGVRVGLGRVPKRSSPATTATSPRIAAESPFATTMTASAEPR